MGSKTVYKAGLGGRGVPITECYDAPNLEESVTWKDPLVLMVEGCSDGGRVF